MAGEPYEEEDEDMGEMGEMGEDEMEPEPEDIQKDEL